MKLRLLSIEGDHVYEKENDITPIRVRTHYMTELFLHFFHNVDLDGSGKLVIYFREKPEHENKYMRDDYFHVSWYYVDKGLWDKMNTLEDDALAEFILTTITDACKYIALFHGRDKEFIGMIDAAADKIRENRFALVILQKRLSKTSADRRFGAKVYRKLNCQGEIWYVELENKGSKTITRCEIMDHYTNISLEDAYKKASWEDNKFILRDELDREEAAIEVSETGCSVASLRSQM